MHVQQTPIRHLAIIPDGNRRWAKKHAIFAEPQIYEHGSDTTTQIVEAAFEYGVQYVTFWASSYANLLSRPKVLITPLERVYERKFYDLTTDPKVFREKVHVQVLGEWRDLLKKRTQTAAQAAINATAHHHNKFFTLLVGYDGRRECGAALQSFAASGQQVASDLPAAEQQLRDHAWTGHLPNVDLIIRTGAWQDPHNSAGFLGFLGGDAQFVFPKVLWPDFTPQMLRDICDDFARRERRFGR